MKIIKPSVKKIVFYIPEDEQSIEQGIEEAGRNCYKSEDKITSDSADKFIRILRNRGHEAMLEFGFARVHVSADRGLTHELVRHRVASFAQESTRYCNYSKGKFGSEITVVEQPGIDEISEIGMKNPEERSSFLQECWSKVAKLVYPNYGQKGDNFMSMSQKQVWDNAMKLAENHYVVLLEMGVKPEIARSVLPIGLKSDIVVAANLREWRHIFKMRCSSKAHPIIRGIMLECLKKFNEKVPSVYEDLADEYLTSK